MSKRVVLVSDMSGKPLDAKEAVKVTLTYADARKGQVVLDASESEVADLASKGQKQARRGRRPAAA
jgi:hypothetical protein